MTKALMCLAIAMVALSCSGDGPAERDDSGLVAHYLLDGNADDALGQSPGTAVATEAVTDRNGIAGGAMRFNGQNAYVEIAHTAALSLRNEFTISAWILAREPNNTGEFWSIFEKSDPERGGHSRYGLWLRDGLLWTCLEVADNSEQPCADTATPLTSNEWHHVAAVRAGRRALLYIDGVQVVDSFVGNRDISQTEFSAFMGTDRYEEPAVWLDADLDDVRIYGRPLPADEILALAGS